MDVYSESPLGFVEGRPVMWKEVPPQDRMGALRSALEKALPLVTVPSESTSRLGIATIRWLLEEVESCVQELYPSP